MARNQDRSDSTAPVANSALAAELQEKSESLECAQELANVASWDFAISKQTGAWSRQMYTMFDRDPSLGVPEFPVFLELLHPEDRDKILEYQARAIVSGERLTFRFRSNPDRGPMRHFVSTIQRRANDDDVVSGAILDETERVEAAATLERLRNEERRRATLESLSALSAGLAHDLNNIVSVIVTNAAFLADHVADEPEPKAALDDVRAVASRATELIKGMLAFSGRRARQAEWVDVREVLGEAIAGMGSSRAFRLEGPAHLPVVHADRPQLVQLVGALLQNAMEATEPADSIAVVAGPCGNDDEPRLCVEVCDAGRGMTEATRARAFEPFFTTKFLGRGLGLAAARGIVKAHGGSIELRCDDQRGTVARIEFPARAETPSTERPEERAAPSGGGRVLLVDDEPELLRSMERVLTMGGHVVVAVASGVDAVETLAGHGRFDLVVLDMTMPGLDGPATLSRLRAIDADLPALLCSGYHQHGDPASLRSLGAQGFVAKPFEIDDLLAAVSRVLEAVRR